MVVTQMSPEIYSAYRIGVGSPSAIFRLAPLAPPLTPLMKRCPDSIATVPLVTTSGVFCDGCGSVALRISSCRPSG